MKEYTMLDRIKDVIRRPYQKIKFYFAKKWLDENFGHEDYWGEKISELFRAQKTLDDQRIAYKENK